MSNEQGIPAAFQIGTDGIITVDLVPRIKLKFDQLQATSRQGFDLTIPITGTCENVKGDMECGFAWSVLQDGETKPKTGALVQGVIKAQSDGSFELKIGDTTPVANIIKDGLWNTGRLGCRVSPSFSHAGVFDVPKEKCLEFEFPIKVDVTIRETKAVEQSAESKVEERGAKSKAEKKALALGTPVVLCPAYHNVFNEADIVVEFFEEDRGKQEVQDDDNHVVSLRWQDGNTDTKTWPLGFATDQPGSQVLYFERHEAGDYEIGYRIRVGYQATPEQWVESVFLTKHGFAQWRKPRLTKFELTFAKDWLIFRRVKADIAIANLAPECSLPLDVALCYHRTVDSDPKGQWPPTTVEAELVGTGEFTATLLSDLFWNSESIPDKDEIFGVLSLRRAVPDAEGFVPLFQILEHEEKAFLPINNNFIAHKHNSVWACSREATGKVVTASELLDNADVKRVLYAQGKERADARRFFDTLLDGSAKRPPTRNRCDRAVASALQRALVFLGYPTSTTGKPTVDGGYGSGSNLGFALFLREQARDLLQDSKGNPIEDATLFSKKGLAGALPDVLVDCEGFNVLILSLGLALKRRCVWFGDVNAAIENLDSLQKESTSKKADGLTVEQILDKHRKAIETAVQHGTSKGLPVKPQWLAALIAVASNGRVRMHLDSNALGRWCEKRGAVFGGNVMEYRLRCTRLGLPNRPGADCELVAGKTARDLCWASATEQLCWMVDVLLEHKDQSGVATKLTNIAPDEVKKLCHAYLGTTGPHNTLLAAFNRAEEAWE